MKDNDNLPELVERFHLLPRLERARRLDKIHPVYCNKYLRNVNKWENAEFNKRPSHSRSEGIRIMKILLGEGDD